MDEPTDKVVMESPLINLALLETLKTERFNDEIDLFLPFVAVTIRELEKPIVQAAEIQTKLAELFGFRPPISAIKVLMSRAKSKGLLLKENHAFIPCANKINEWSNGYQQKKEDLQVSLGSLKTALIEFAADNFQKDITPQGAESLIFHFIQENVSSAVSRRAYNKAELNNSIKNANHVIAVFISYIHKKEPQLMEHFGRCVKGMLLANYLYFADKITSKKSFEKISVYLDSPLVIGLLGYNGSFNKQANEEFIELLQSLKIKVCIYDKTLDEIEGLLSAWKNDFARKIFTRFNTKTLELLRSQGYDEARFDTEIKTLQRTIESKGIEVIFGFSAKQRFQCDEIGLEKAIAENFRKDKNLTHDTICISRTHNLREGKHIQGLNEQFSVFVTANTGLAKFANGFFSKNNYRSAIPVVVSEQWMTIMFWLKNPDITSKLPTDQVVATAYSLLYTDDKFWDAFLERLESIKKRGIISEEDFILVRWDSDLLRTVQDASVDVGDDFSEEDVFDIVEGVKRKYIIDSKNTLDEFERSKAEEIQRVRNEAQAEIAAEKEARAAEKIERDDLSQTHKRLKEKVRAVSRTTARCISAPISLTLIIFLILSIIQTIPNGILPASLQLIKLPTSITTTTFIITALWGLSSWIFGISIKTVNKKIEDWVFAKIINYFTN